MENQHRHQREHEIPNEKILKSSCLPLLQKRLTKSVILLAFPLRKMYIMQSISRKESSMLSGYLLAVFLGFVWTAVGITIALARKQQCPIWSFYSIGATFAILLSLPFCPLSVTNLSPGGISLLALGASAIAFGQTLSMRFLQGQGRAVLFSIHQMNFLFSFIRALIFLSEKVTVFSLLGMLSLTVSIVGISMFGNAEADRTFPPFRSIMFTVAAAMICGVGQYLLLLGNRFLPDAPSAFKGVIVLFFCAVFYALGIPLELKELQQRRKNVLRFAALWAVSAAISYRVLFIAIEKMSAVGRGGLVYAIGSSVSILLFFLFAVFQFKDKTSKVQIALIAGIIAGVILLRF